MTLYSGSYGCSCLGTVHDADCWVLRPAMATVTNLRVTFGTPSSLCPDLLRLDQIGEADGWRGRVVRGFFRLLKIVTGV